MEITKEYKRAYVEVLEVLKVLDKSDYSKIPIERIELYEKNKDKYYFFEFDETKEINKQISKKSQAILANLFIRFISNSEDRKMLLEQKRKQLWKMEEEKENLKLNPLFERKKQVVDENISKVEESQYPAIKKHTFLERILIKIKKFFRKNI